jgi:hypothetical protein
MSSPIIPLLDELALLIDAVSIHTGQELFFAGRLLGPGPPEWPAAFPPPLPPLLSTLHYWLYSVGYCRRFAGRLPAAAPPAPFDPAFRDALAQANSGRTRLDPAWQVIGRGPRGQFWLKQEGLGRAVWPGAFVTLAGPDQEPRAGQPASLHWPHESWSLQPGSYVVFGAAIPDSVADAPAVRFYWHIQAAGAARLLGALRAALDRFAIPFRFKCPAHPALYDRRDAAVLYVGRRDYRLVARLVAQVYQGVQADLRPDTPLFTRTLAPGLALADDPGTVESFGQQRCRLLTEALWRAHETGSPPGAARLEAVCAHFAQAGIDLQRPHLVNSGVGMGHPHFP